FLTAYKGTSTVLGGVVAAFAVIGGYLTALSVDLPALLGAYPGLYWTLGSFLICGIGIGTWIGITIHRNFASSRDAPLGYRIDKVEHLYNFDPTNPQLQTRRRTESITAKRDEVNLIVGRYRPSMHNPPVLKSVHNDV